MDARSVLEYRIKVGVLACSSETIEESERWAVIAARLGPDASWPPLQDIRIAAVDAASGERVMFSSGQGISLIDAVAASCATRHLAAGVHRRSPLYRWSHTLHRQR